MAAFQHHTGVVDADLGEMGRPGFERGTIGHGERQMIEAVAGLSGRGASWRRRLGQHHDELPATVLQRDAT